MSQPALSPATHWPRVALIVGAGIAAAVHIGKMPGSLPVLSADLRLDLTAAALLTAIYSLVAATGGLLLGLGARRTGGERLVIIGLLLATAASCLGAVVTDAAALLATRVVEGLGFIIVAVSAPTLIMAATHPQDRRLAMGLWGTYVPAGTSLMMLVTAGSVGAIGWRGVWGVAAALTGALALALWVASLGGARPTPAQATDADWRIGLADAVTPASRWMAACFAVYGAQYLAVVAFLPTLLVETAGVPIATAGILGALVAAANALGNIAAGWIGARGWQTRHVIMLGAAGMGLGSLPIFAVGAPVWSIVSSAMAFCAIGGLIPGTLLGAAPRIARSPAAAAAVVGLMIQGAGVGQLVGPPVFAEIVKRTGSWSGAWIYTVGAALLLVLLATRVRVPEPMPLSDTPSPTR